MDFAAILKAEVDRKRKVIENKNVLNPQKKYFKRGDLERKEREEYEAKHNVKRLEPEASTSAVKESPSDELTPGLDEGKLPMTLSRQEVVKRLRERSEPIRLFAESDYEAFQRLRKLEIMAPDINKGLRNDFKVALDQLEQENIDEMIKQQTVGNSGQNVTVETLDDDVTLESLQKLSKNLGRGNDNEDCDVILKTMKFLLKCWAKELNEIPEENKKGKWKIQSAIHRQTQTYLSPLFNQLKNKTVATDILEYLSGIIKHILTRDYVKASAIYLQMAIGNAPWPIGVTMVGIHARTGREKIFSQQIAHVLNDETQRKFIQGLKRIMTACQRIFPTDPSKSLEYNATQPL
uniref:Pre-mRNA-splicing factor 18 n=1 Tax=Ciona intestinalis TaxID=7719 RepID=H2XK69_CIOIN|nr:pre-mRNA-splicing factor 18-like [Ciona intestinalis]|eukprot:XP_002129784.1 pre-mRNA-splicing factor 18-like [Ciona intestinalis]